MKFIDEEFDKDKCEKQPVPPVEKPAQASNSQKQAFNNMSLRTQSFNQNHPAFPMPPPQQPDYLMNLRGQTDKTVNYQFPKTDVPPPNFMPAYHNNQNKPININLNQKPPNFPHNIPPPNSYSSNNSGPIQGAFPNMQFSPPSNFNNWKREEITPQVPNAWWQSSNLPAQQVGNFE